jgi:hypothetical protein
LLGEVDITLLMADLQLIFIRTQEMVPYGESALSCLAQYCLLVFVSESAIFLYSGKHYEKAPAALRLVTQTLMCSSALSNIPHLSMVI